MRRFLLFLVLMPTLLMAQASSRTEQVAPLRFDPFQAAISQVAGRQSPAGGSGNSSARWSPELRATLIGEGYALANVDGMLLSPGDELQGYKLVRVEERKAIFERGGQRIVLSLDP